MFRNGGGENWKREKKERKREKKTIFGSFQKTLSQGGDDFENKEIIRQKAFLEGTGFIGEERNAFAGRSV